MKQNNNTLYSQTSIDRLKKDINKTFATQTTKSEQSIKLDQYKKRIMNVLSQMDDKTQQVQLQQSQSEISTQLLLSAKNAIIENIKVLQPSDKNLKNIEKNLDKLFTIQEELQVHPQNKEIKQLLWKIETKITQQTNLSKSINDDKKCQICFEKDKEYVAIPCGHYIYCKECKELIKKDCLICRNPITSVMKIYQ
ncbi:unnamed protein product [Paramecium sonneborni]|uniref:RING-type domain-containing protein n=1 Tax=Paramecium sonneborni TaxID=65129 RepID=A0A8S1LK39_9CILI|nr:unnamed protein product [Paramecium sonneborni]